MTAIVAAGVAGSGAAADAMAVEGLADEAPKPSRVSVLAEGVVAPYIERVAAADARTKATALKERWVYQHCEGPRACADCEADAVMSVVASLTTTLA